MDYQVLAVESQYCSKAEMQLKREVKDLLDQGWKLQGGVSIAITVHGHSEYYTLAQAMVK